MELLIEAVCNSEFTILVLSRSYIFDHQCRHVTVTAYTLRPHSLTPIARDKLTESDIFRHPIMMGLIRTNGLLQWSDEEVEQAAFWDQLTQRLHEECGGHIESEAMLAQSAVENIFRCDEELENSNASYENYTDIQGKYARHLVYSFSYLGF